VHGIFHPKNPDSIDPNTVQQAVQAAATRANSNFNELGTATEWNVTADGAAAAVDAGFHGQFGQ